LCFLICRCRFWFAFSDLQLCFLICSCVFLICSCVFLICSFVFLICLYDWHFRATVHLLSKQQIFIHLRFVYHMVGLQLDGEFHPKFRGEWAHGWQGSGCQHNAVHRPTQVRESLGSTNRDWIKPSQNQTWRGYPNFKASLTNISRFFILLCPTYLGLP